MQTEVVTTEQHDGYEVRHEWAWHGDQEDEKVMLDSAYTSTGQYIGDPEMAKRLITELGIAPEYRLETSGCCTIGYSATLEKWFGWSHRAICGFGIGDKLFDLSWPDGTEATPFIEYGAITISGLEEARQAAFNFAEYVR